MAKKTYDQLAHVYNEEGHGQSAGNWTPLSIEFLQPGHLESILDVGCGSGTSTFPLADQTKLMIGIDNSYGMLGEGLAAKRKDGIHNVHFVLAEIEQLPFRNGSFDATVSRFAVHHTDLSRSLKEMRRLVKPGGKILIMDVVGTEPWEQSRLRYFIHIFWEIAQAVRYRKFRRVRKLVAFQLHPAWIHHTLTENKKVSSEEFEAVSEQILPGVEVSALGRVVRLVRWSAPAQ